MIRARKTSRWLLVLAFTMRLSSLCWLAVTSIGTGAGMNRHPTKSAHTIQSLLWDITLGQIMDRINIYGVGTIIRVIPNPAKAIGFNILSLFHYQSDTTIITCEDLAEASSLLE